MPRSTSPFIRFITNILIDIGLSKNPRDPIGDTTELTTQVTSAHQRNTQGNEGKGNTLADSLSGKYAKDVRNAIKEANEAWLRAHPDPKNTEGYVDFSKSAAHAHLQELAGDMDHVVGGAVKGSLKDRTIKPEHRDEALILKEQLEREKRRNS